MAKILEFKPHPKQVELLESDAPRVVYYGGHPGGASNPWFQMLERAKAACESSAGVPEAATTTAGGRVTSWLNNMHRLKCGECAFEWSQPASSGRCPQCRSEKSELLFHWVNDAIRV